MFIGRRNFLFHSLVCNLIMSSVMWNILVRYSSVHHGLGDSSCKRTAEPIYGLSLAPRGQHHVALTSMMWSSVAGSTRTCCMWLWLNTSPGPNESSRGMAIPFCWCSLLPTECTLPRLRMLAVSIWSSSRDKLSFSMQLSEDIKQKFQFQVSFSKKPTNCKFPVVLTRVWLITDPCSVGQVLQNVDPGVGEVSGKQRHHLNLHLLTRSSCHRHRHQPWTLPTNCPVTVAVSHWGNK